MDQLGYQPPLEVNTELNPPEVNTEVDPPLNGPARVPPWMTTWDTCPPNTHSMQREAKHLLFCTLHLGPVWF